MTWLDFSILPLCLWVTVSDCLGVACRRQHLRSNFILPLSLPRPHSPQLCNATSCLHVKVLLVCHLLLLPSRWKAQGGSLIAFPSPHTCLRQLSALPPAVIRCPLPVLNSVEVVRLPHFTNAVCMSAVCRPLAVPAHTQTLCACVLWLWRADPLGIGPSVLSMAVLS